MTTQPRNGFTRNALRPEDQAAYDAVTAFDARIARIHAENGGPPICRRCRKEAWGWPAKRGDRCNVEGAVHCLRDPETVIAENERMARK